MQWVYLQNQWVYPNKNRDVTSNQLGFLGFATAKKMSRCLKNMVPIPSDQMIEKPFSIYYIKQQLWRIPHIQWCYRGDRLWIDLCQRLRRLWTHTGRLCLVSTVPNLVLNSDPHMLGWNQHGSKSVCSW
jgi:hypothetical protein